MIADFFIRAGFSPAEAPFWALIVLLAILALACWRWRATAVRAASAEASAQAFSVDLAAAEARNEELASLRDALQFATDQKNRLEAEAAANAVRLAEREKALNELRARMETEFRAAAGQMLDSAHRAFLQRANETFERHREASQSEADKRRTALDELIRPMSETLTRYEKGLAEMRSEHMRTAGDLVGRIGELSKSAVEVRIEAQKLAAALRAGPKTRGRWGEEQLRNVVETAGMRAYVDFLEQPSHDDGERRKQPDMVVNLPGGRKIAIDSKVSINAYLDAVDAESEAERAAHFARHAEDVWLHVKTLSSRDYAASLKESLDVVVMFVPGENYFAAAVEARPALIQEAFDRKILIASPMTLVAMLKAASFSWRQEKASESARAVAGMARELYDSLRIMTGHLTALGRSLDGAVGKYNAAIGGFERRVLPRARRLAEYEMPGTEEPIPELPMIDSAPGALRAQADLFPPSADSEADQSAA